MRSSEPDGANVKVIRTAVNCNFFVQKPSQLPGYRNEIFLTLPGSDCMEKINVW